MRVAQVHVHEATQQAGGRCRSYFDAATNLTIDNGNHLLLSGNRHALAYARSIGTEAGLVGPKRAQFPFVDLATGERWQLDLGDGRLPLWVFDEARRVPDTGLRDYLALMPLIWAGTGKLVGKTIPCEGTLYQRLVQPLLLAALNVDPPEGSAGLAGAIVRETLLAGGHACRPLIARDGLSAALVDPALKLLRQNGATVQFGHELRGLDVGGNVGELNFGDDIIALARRRCRGDGGAAAFGGGAAAGPENADQIPRHRQRAFPLRSAARHAADHRAWSAAWWNGCSRFRSGCRSPSAMPTGWSTCRARNWRRRSGGISARPPALQAELPPWQIVRERRATFEATPEQNALRPGAVDRLEKPVSRRRLD